MLIQEEKDHISMFGYPSLYAYVCGTGVRAAIYT